MEVMQQLSNACSVQIFSLRSKQSGWNNFQQRYTKLYVAILLLATDQYHPTLGSDSLALCDQLFRDLISPGSVTIPEISSCHVVFVIIRIAQCLQEDLNYTDDNIVGHSRNEANWTQKTGGPENNK